MEIVQTAKLTEDEVRAMVLIAEIKCNKISWCDDCCLCVNGRCVRNEIRDILDLQHYAYEK